MADDPAATPVGPFVKGYAFSKALFDEGASESSVNYSSSKRWSFPSGGICVPIQVMSSSSAVMTSDPTGAPFNTSFNVSDHLKVPKGCVVLPVFTYKPWDNPDNIISQEVEAIFEWITAVFFINLLYLISAPTNILSMAVFTKHGLKERINLCLFFQSLADIIYMTVNFTLYADRIYLAVSGKTRRGALIKLLLNNYFVGFFGFSWASKFVTMVIACERCFCVLSPLRSQHVLKTKTTLVVILVSWFFLVGGFFLVGSRWSVACIFNPRTASTTSHLYPSKFYFRNKTLIDTLDAYVYRLILPMTFFVLITISTIITIVKLKKLASWREQSSSAVMTIRDIALTRMLIGCSILFIVCIVPALTLGIMISLVPDLNLSGRYSNMFSFLISMTLLGSCVNSSCNFFIYYTMGTKFRATLHTLFRRKGKAKGNDTRNLRNDSVSTHSKSFSTDISMK